MATSRTGTAKYKKWRRGVLHKAQMDGITHCPCTWHCKHHTQQCLVRLDYTQGRKPNSAEPDHIQPWSRGGTDTPENGTVLCRRCNQSQGNKRIKTKPKTLTPQTSQW